MIRARQAVIVVLGCWVTTSCNERPTLCPDNYFNGEIDVPAFSATVNPPIDSINVNLTGGPTGTIVSISESQGTIAFEDRGPVRAFLFLSEPQAGNQGILYGGLGMGDGAWFPFWLYCSTTGRLTRIFGEMTDRDVGLDLEVDGTCTDTGTPATKPIVFQPQILTNVALTCGFTADAPGMPVSLMLRGGQPGHVSFDGDDATVLPFHTVDCRSGCGSPGWYELHTLVWDPSRSVVAFSVFYLASDGVTASDGISLPSGDAIIDAPFPGGSWSLSR